MKLSNIVVVGALIALFVAPTIAQAQGGGQGGQGRGQGGQGRGQGGFGGGQRQGGFGMGQFGGQSSLQTLNRADVQADLKITADQKTAITKLQSDMQAKRQEQMQALRGNGGGGGGFDREAMTAAFEKMQKEEEAAVNKILTAEQQARLKQITFQMRGANALTDATVQKELDFTTAQKRKVEDLQTAQQEANMAVFQRMRNGEIDQSEIQGIMEKNNKALETELLKVLTPEQKTKFDSMKGAEFKRDPKVDEAMRNNRGGGAGGRGTGGGGGRGGSTGGGGGF